MAAALLLVAGLTAAGPARAADPGEATGPTGQKLTVSAVKDIDPAGQRVTVTGSGYDPAQGVYLAVCVIPKKPGEPPSPCLGGMDLTGGSGSSIWISNNPPDYAKDLVRPFTVKDGKGGFTFDLTVKIKDSNADCAKESCAIVTRADHTDISDRKQDVIVPITFGKGSPPTPETPPGTVRHTEVRQYAPTSGGVVSAAVDPAAGRVYVSGTGTAPEGRLSVYDTLTGAPVGDPVELPGVAQSMALDAGSGALHLGLDDRVATYHTKTGKIIDNRTPVVKESVGRLAMDPAADRLYVANKNRDEPTVTVYDTKDAKGWKAVGEPAALAFTAADLAVDTKRHIGYAVYVGRAQGDSVLTNNLDGIDGATGRLTGSLSLGTTGMGSQGVAVDSETGTGYVANMGVNSVSIVDLESHKVTGSVTVSGNPQSLAYDSGTGTLYAAQFTGGTVAVVDPARHKVLQVLETGKRPTGLALDAKNHTLFTVSNGTGKVVQTQRQVSPGVTAEPKAVTVRAGKQAVLKAAGEGTPEPSATWEVSTDEGRSWQPIADSYGPEFSFRATVEHDGNRYRAVFSNPVGSTRSTGAEVSVTAAPDPDPDPSPSPSPNDPDPGPDGSGGGDSDGGDSGGGEGSAGGSGDSGSSGSSNSGGSGDSSGSGGSASGGTAGGGGTGGGSAHGGDGKLASTGATVLPFALAAAALTALGAAALALRRRMTSP
ncbi:endoglucanase [Streptomyces sp. NPDC014894]|uniref:endoglucanase n=1 Tax=Streptomyces sp. NPDC014894 TaxID=3364931 RepID=UPI003702A836